MCEFNANLVAWLDGELPEADAMVVADHIAVCAECRHRADTYRQVGLKFATAHLADRSEPAPILRTPSPYRPLAWAMLAAAAIVGALLLLPRNAKQPAPPVPVAVVTPGPTVEVATPATQPTSEMKRVSSQRKRPTKLPEVRQWAASQPTIQIAIPADAVFPPGAVPQGFAYVANLSFSPDGSVREVRLQQ